MRVRLRVGSLPLQEGDSLSTVFTHHSSLGEEPVFTTNQSGVLEDVKINDRDMFG